MSGYNYNSIFFHLFNFRNSRIEIDILHQKCQHKIMPKITVTAPANIAFIKYWGRSEHSQYIARNTSISMNLSGCTTTTTAEVGDFTEDEIVVEFYQQNPKKLAPDNHKTKALFAQIERVRKLAGSNKKVRIYSVNNFPADSGIASSASGFAALTAALLIAFGRRDLFDDKQEFSRQIRLCGSGSAIRSGLDGFVEFLAPKEAYAARGGFKKEELTEEFLNYLHQQSYANQIANETHWDLVDIVAVVNPEKKLVSSSQGHLMADTSPYFETRVDELQERVERTRQAILDKDFSTLGQMIEEDSTSMHAVMMTSKPAIFYWSPGSMRVMLEVMKWRKDGELESYFTLDAGCNVHVICQKKDAAEVTKRLESLPEVQWTIYNENCKGVQEV